MNLTDQQKDLLRLLVSKHQSNGGLAFIFVRSHSGSAVSYPGGVSVSVENDETDFYQLAHDNLVNFARVSQNVYRGKPTQLGITAVITERNPQTPSQQQQRHSTIGRDETTSLPMLSASTERELALRWEQVLEKRDLTGKHFHWHDKVRDRSGRIVMRPGVDRRLAQIGVAQSVVAAELSFKDVVRTYFEIWDRTGEKHEVFKDWLPSVTRRVLQDMAVVWRGRDVAIDEWYEKVCEPTIKNALTTLETEWGRRARDRELLKLGRAKGSQSRPAEIPAEVSFPRPERWEDIELSFVGDHDVEIRIGDKSRKLNYKEIQGFEDRRTGNPNQHWGMARGFGQFPNGIMPEHARAGKEWLAIQKTVERTSKALREHFGMTGDPFPYIRGTGYRTRITIKIAPAPTV